MEERKIQLSTGVDASGAKQGFEQVKADARDMAQAVAQAGQTAGKGMDAISDGAKRAADGTNRALTSLRSQMQRAALDLQTAGKSLSQKFEIKADFKGIDRGDIQSELALLKQLEQAQASAAGSAKGQAFIGDLQGQLAALREQATLQGKSADEALRYKAAQLGVAQAAEPLIAELHSIQAAQEAVANAARSAAQAEKEAAAVSANKSSFLAGLQQQVGAIGKSRADLLELRAAELGVAEAAGPMIAKLREADQTQRGFAANGKLNAYQLQQVGFQLHDFGVQVLSGQNVLTAFVQQGSQLSGTFGGAGNAFRAITSLLTGMRLAMLGAAAGVGVLALGMAEAEKSARSLATVQAQLAGTGRQEMFSNSGLREFIKELSLAPGVTRETATAIVSELSKAHDIGGAVFKDLGRIAADYAKATGQDIPAATKQLTQAFAEPIKGANDLDEALNHRLPSGQILLIQRLARTGDQLGALIALLKALQQAVQGTNERFATPLQKSFSDLGNAWEQAGDKFKNSEGLRNLNAELALTIKGIAWLIENIPKIPGIGEVASAAATAGRNLIPGAALIGAAGRLAGGTTEKDRTSSGKVTDASQSAATGVAAGATGANAEADKAIKRAVDVANAHRSEAGQIKDLLDYRTQLNTALTKSIDLAKQEALAGKPTDDRLREQARLRDGISGINKQISSLGKGQGVLDAQLQTKIQAAQDALARERDTLSFQDRFLQGQYQAGQLSLVDFYDKKRQAIAAGTAAEIAALEAERKAVEQHLAKSREPDKKEQDRKQLAKIDLQEADARTRGDRETQLTNQQKEESFRQLDDQLKNYRANLLQLAGDEAGAARLRNEVIDRQDKLLQEQTKGRPGALTDDDVANAKAQRDQQVALNDAKSKTSLINQQLQIEEDRIALAQQTGAIGEIDALKAEGTARAQAVAKMQEQLALLEKLSQERPQDLQLKVDVEGFRLQIDKLKASLDPLKDKFDSIFKDAGSNLFSDLMNGTKPRDIVRNLANNIAKPINDMVGKSLSEQVFGKDGALGGAGGFFADLFGGKDRNKPKASPIDTSDVDQSLATLRASGIDPTTDALARLQAAADRAAGAIGGTGDFSRLDRGETTDSGPTTGDFSRLDRGQTGEQSVIDMFRNASSSSETLGASNTKAADAALQLASAAARGGGALSSLPSIIQSIITAASAGSAAGGIGGGLGGLFSLFGGGGVSDFAFGSTTFADAFAAGVIPLSSGGYTGAADPRKIAGVVHGQEYVFSAPAVKAIGLDRLERLHEKAKAGRMDDEGVPGYSDGGYVTTSPMTWQSSTVQHLAPPQMKAGDTYVTHQNTNVTVQMPVGGTRQTGMQAGAAAARELELARRRQGK